MAPPCIRAAFFDLGDTLVVPADRSWVPGAADLLAEFRSRGVRLGVISNTGTLTRDQLARLLPPDFDWAVFDPGLVTLRPKPGSRSRPRPSSGWPPERPACRPGSACSAPRT